MEEIVFFLTFVIILGTFLIIGNFASGALSTGTIAGLIVASFAYLGVYSLRHGKLI